MQDKTARDTMSTHAYGLYWTLSPKYTILAVALLLVLDGETFTTCKGVKTHFVRTTCQEVKLHLLKPQSVPPTGLTLQSVQPTGLKLQNAPPTGNVSHGI